MTDIIYIHGFGSSPKSKKVAILKDHFNVATPTLGVEYDKVMRALETFILDYIYTYEVEPILVGTSMGGTLATIMGRRHGLSFVALNPSTQPSITLQRPVFKTFVPGWTDEKAMKWKPLEDQLSDALSKPVEYPSCVMVEKGDEELDYSLAVAKYKDACEVVVLEGGSHRFNDVEAVINKIKEIENTIVL